jgi:peptidylprolyl isomerase
MARRPARTPLAVEPLEGRRVMAANVAVGSEIGATSTPLVRLVDADTGAVKAQVLAFEASFKGGVRVAMGDLDGDAVPEVLAASGPGRVGEIRVFKQQVSGGTTTLTELVAYRTLPFGLGYKGGVEIAVGDLDGNGREDIVAAMSRGAGTVNAFLSVAAADPVQNDAFKSFTPFGPTFTGGASVAVADLGTFSGGKLVNGETPDNKVEIIVGSGAGMRAAVLVYDVSAAPRVIARIASATGQGGVALATGRVNADAIDDIIVSAGRGGGGVTEVYSGRTAAAGGAERLTRFAAFTGLARPNAPVFAAGVDSDGDGRIDRYLATQGDGGGTAGIVRASPATGARVAAFSTVAGPLRVAAARTSFREVTTNTGLKYRDIIVGQGATPTTGQLLTVHYTGRLADGTVFDSSVSRGQPFQFTLGVGEVIAGWDEGLATMKVGGWRKLVIPPALGYGSVPNGNIPANATLFFDVQLLAIG